MNLLTPHGPIALAELSLMQDVLLLMLIISFAVFALAFFFAWWYRESNTKARYEPNWEHGALTELVWWAIPIEIVLILGALTWTSTHALDPKKPLQSSEAPITIEVIALPSKWLFIYPTEGVASVNTVAVPVGRPVHFEVTADAPMNSFWIPELGGQIYAMTGMSTSLNLLASDRGVYQGASANYSGEGFASMTFSVIALDQVSFNTLMQTAHAKFPTLTREIYTSFVDPQTVPEMWFRAADADLYHAILMKYASSGSAHTH